MLLVSADDVPEATDAALRRLGPRRIVVLGGTSVVSEEVEQELGGYGAAVERREGAERYATSAEVADASFRGVDTVYVASGGRFPDALAGVPAATLAGGPVLLVEPDAVPSVVGDQLDRLAPDEIVVLGGEAVVSQGVEAALEAHLRTSESASAASPRSRPRSGPRSRRSPRRTATPRSQRWRPAVARG